MRPFACLLLAAVLVAHSHPSAARAHADDPPEANAGQTSRFAELVPREQVERMAASEYQALLRSAAAKRMLVPANAPQVQRLRRIANQLIPHTQRFSTYARAWNWEVNLIAHKQINAFCMPGGKIAFYTGLLDGLKLSDAEAAAVMGHEMAHALREHARERMGKSAVTQIGASLLGKLIGGGEYAELFARGGQLLTLKFSRDDEREADVVGLELMARAGYDPRTAISLWKKMNAAASGAPLEFLSTHPSGDSRIEEIERQLPRVLPLYEQSIKK